MPFTSISGVICNVYIAANVISRDSIQKLMGDTDDGNHVGLEAVPIILRETLNKICALQILKGSTNSQNQIKM